jgi:hypothetical protein
MKRASIWKTVTALSPELTLAPSQRPRPAPAAQKAKPLKLNLTGAKVGQRLDDFLASAYGGAKVAIHRREGTGYPGEVGFDGNGDGFDELQLLPNTALITGTPDHASLVLNDNDSMFTLEIDRQGLITATRDDSPPKVVKAEPAVSAATLAHVKKYAAMKIEDLIPPDARAAVVRYPGSSPSYPTAHFDTPNGRYTASLVPGAILVYTAYDSQSDEGVYFSLADGKPRAAHLYAGGYYYFDGNGGISGSEPHAESYSTAYDFLNGIVKAHGAQWKPENPSLQNLIAAGKLPQQKYSGVETLFPE